MQLPISYERVLRNKLYEFNYLVDVKSILGSPEQQELFRELAELIPEDVIAIGGVVSTGAVLASGLALYLTLVLNRPTQSFYIRKEPKQYDRVSIVEGSIPTVGSKVALVDDFFGSGKAMRKAAEACNSLGLVVAVKAVACMASRSASEASDVHYLCLSAPFYYPEPSPYKGRLLSVTVSALYDKRRRRGKMVLHENRILLASADGYFYQLDQYSLSLLHQTRLGYSHKDFRSGPEVHSEGSIFLTSNSGVVFKIVGDSVVAQTSLKSYFHSWVSTPCPPTTYGEHLYVGVEVGVLPSSTTGGVLKLDLDLNPILFFPAGALVASKPLLLGNFLYFGANDGVLYKYDVDPGKERLIWALDLQSEVHDRLTVVTSSGDQILCATKDSFVVCIDAAEGSVVWKRRIAVVEAPEIDPRTGFLYGVAVNGSPFLLSPNNGEVLVWKRHEGSQIGSPTILRTNLGYVYNTVNSVVESDTALNPLRVLSQPSGVGGLLVSNDSLYIETCDGRLDRIAPYAS